jgi:hypothetical protein
MTELNTKNAEKHMLKLIKNREKHEKALANERE